MIAITHFNRIFHGACHLDTVVAVNDSLGWIYVAKRIYNLETFQRPESRSETVGRIVELHDHSLAVVALEVCGSGAWRVGHDAGTVVTVLKCKTRETLTHWDLLRWVDKEAVAAVSDRSHRHIGHKIEDLVLGLTEPGPVVAFCSERRELHVVERHAVVAEHSFPVVDHGGEL